MSDVDNLWSHTRVRDWLFETGCWAWCIADMIQKYIRACNFMIMYSGWSVPKIPGLAEDNKTESLPFSSTTFLGPSPL